MILALAEQAAVQLLDLLRPCCAFAAVAGSVRRQCPDVGDVELVLVPAPVPNPYKGDLFGASTTAQLDLLADKLAALRGSQTLVPRPAKDGKIAWGQRAVRAVFHWSTARGGGLAPLQRHAPVDLFIVRPPAQLGLIYFIRTGDADFAAAGLSQWKAVSNGGWSEGGCLHDRHGQPVPTPTEPDVFRALGWDFVPPEQRGQRSKAAGKLELPAAPPPRAPVPAADCDHDWSGDLVSVGDGHWRPRCVHCGVVRPASDLV